MRTCDRKITRWCPGHSSWEKLPDCLVEALYCASPDESTGSVEWDIWVGLYLVDEAESIAGPRGWSVDIPAGTYGLLAEDDHGRVTWTEYPSAQATQDVFNHVERQYGLWLDAQDRREQEIMIMSGRIGR